MKVALVLFVLCAAFLSVYSLPAPEGTEQPAPGPWYNPFSYDFMACRMTCRQNCLEQGYWKGVCKLNGCYCFGPMGPMYPRMKEFSMPYY